MNLLKRFALTLAVAAIPGLGVAGAQAGTVTKATFTLPEQVYWNDTLLPPGDYTLSVERRETGIEMVTIRGEGVAAMFMPLAGAELRSAHSRLTLDNLNGTYVVRQLDAGPRGGSYNFSVSKSVRNHTMSGAVREPVTVPVMSASGQ